jgi:hypothetical protein
MANGRKKKSVYGFFFSFISWMRKKKPKKQFFLESDQNFMSIAFKIDDSSSWCKIN